MDMTNRDGDDIACDGYDKHIQNDISVTQTRDGNYLYGYDSTKRYSIIPLNVGDPWCPFWYTWTHER